MHQPMQDARRQTEDDMLRGYRDGLDANSPEPSANRSASYRHGFANGRDDLAGKARAKARELRIMAREAQEQDMRR